jgi:hypothetical protein
VRFLLLFVSLAAATSCTTLENRRDLYRSPAEGYERWYRHPPPTRLPSLPPGERASTTTRTTTSVRTTERNGVITFPEEPTLPEGQ